MIPKVMKNNFATVFLASYVLYTMRTPKYSNTINLIDAIKIPGKESYKYMVVDLSTPTSARMIKA